MLEWSKTIEDNSAQIYLQHGSPENPLEGRIYPDTCPPVSKKNAIYLMGHTHYRMIKKDKNGALWINPGSLGQPRDGKGFSYCRLDTESRNVIFRTVDIDIMNLVCQIRMNDPGNKYLEEILYRKK